MGLSQYEALFAYAQALNRLDIEPLEPLLSDEFVYESQAVFNPIRSKKKFFESIVRKFQAVKNMGGAVHAEMGMVNAYSSYQPCIILA